MKISIDRADKVFSKYIRLRDKYKCVRCHKFYAGGIGLMACHFWSRRHESTRFSLDNVVSACFGCHQRLDADKQGEFREIMLKRLGKKGYQDLEIQHHLYKKKDRKFEFIKWRTALKQLEELK